VQLGDDHPLYNVVGAALVNGGIIVANGDQTLQYYGIDGKLIRVVGGEGAGPGEFRSLSWLQKIEDHVVVFDRELGRVSEFDGDGAFLRSVNIAPVDGYIGARAAGVFPDRSILVEAAVKQNSTRNAPIVYRDTLALLRYDPNGRLVDSIGTYVWEESYAEPW